MLLNNDSLNDQGREGHGYKKNGEELELREDDLFRAKHSLNRS